MLFENFLNEINVKQLKQQNPNFVAFIDYALKVVDNKYLSYVVKKIKDDEGEHDPLFLVKDILEVVELFDKVIKSGKLDSYIKSGKSSLNTKDINHWINRPLYQLNEFAKAVDKFLTKTEKRKIEKQESEKIYEDDRFLIVVPESPAAACYYGAGTKWCVAASKDNQFWNETTHAAAWIIYVFDSQPIEPNYGKIAAQYYYRRKQWVFWDAEDQGMDLPDVQGDDGDNGAWGSKEINYKITGILKKYVQDKIEKKLIKQFNVGDKIRWIDSDYSDKSGGEAVGIITKMDLDIYNKIWIKWEYPHKVKGKTFGYSLDDFENEFETVPGDYIPEYLRENKNLSEQKQNLAVYFKNGGSYVDLVIYDANSFIENFKDVKDDFMNYEKLLKSGAIIGEISCYKSSYSTCMNAYVISGSMLHPKYRGKGFGKMLYGLLMTAIYPAALTSDRSTVSKKADNLWKGLQANPKIEKLSPAREPYRKDRQFDDYQNPQTDPKKDDCYLHNRNKPELNKAYRYTSAKNKQLLNKLMANHKEVKKIVGKNFNFSDVAGDFFSYYYHE